MKKIQYASDFHRIKSLIDESKSGDYEICLWQKDEATQKRLIHNMKIDRNHFDKKQIWLKSTHSNNLKFALQTNTFYYCFELKIVFKTTLISKEEAQICLGYPEEITLLDEDDAMMEEFTQMKSAEIGEEFSWIKGKKADYQDDLTKVKGKKAEYQDDLTKVKGKKAETSDEMMIVKGGNAEALDDVMKVAGTPNEKEAEEKFKGLRESTRLTPKVDKHVTMIKDSHPEAETEYKLFDLSQGGAGVLIFSQTQFKIGEAISIIAIDAKPIDKVLHGTVVAIRPYDEGKGEWKLGIKFS